MEPISFNADNKHYEALKTSQDKYTKGNDTHKDSLSFPVGTRVAIQCEDCGPWTHGTVEKANGTDQQGLSYIIRVTKTGRLTTQNMRYICSTPIGTEQYLWKQIKKGTGWLEAIFMEARSVK